MWPWKRDRQQPARDTIVREMTPRDLPIPIYLNQRIVFDLLATFEGGISQLTRVRVSSADSERETIDAKAGLGTGNPFAFLGVSFGSSKKTDSVYASEYAEERVHTPVSLFARLRERLSQSALIHDLQGVEAVVVAGDFVEFSATLRKNPMIDVLEGFLNIASFARGIQGATPQGKKHQLPGDEKGTRSTR